MLALIPALALASIHGGAPKLKHYAHPVMIWIPPYKVAASKAALEAAGAAKAITHLALQFWVPTKDGKAALDTKEQEVTEKAILELRDWAHANGIRVMLTVFNGEDDWDWPLAKDGFAAHPDKFMASLCDQVKQYGLDGVDIDLEGPATYEVDKPAYVSFIRKLSQELHARHKQLTLDSFSYKWNAPNQGWWPDLFPLVEGITSMGYEKLGLASSPDWSTYAAQTAAAGKYAAKLQIGVPSDQDKWQGNTSLEQLSWILKDNRAGIGIWDAQLPAKTWKTDPIWSVIQGIAGGK